MRPKHQWFTLVTMAKMLVVAMLLAQADGSPAASTPDKLTQLDEVDVFGTKTLSELRRQLVEAEDRFYEEYNELNDNDDFDITCRVEARTGTRLATRTCVPLYQVEAVRVGAKEAVQIRQGFQSYGGEALLGANSPPVPAAIAIMARRAEFERNMRTTVARSRVLTRLLQERAEAEARLEAAERDKWGPQEEKAADSSPADTSGN